jgi:hypothetical protein
MIEDTEDQAPAGSPRDVRTNTLGGSGTSVRRAALPLNPDPG